jgi:fructokinase
MTAALGLDLGGSKIEGVALAADGSEMVRMRVPTPPDSYESVIEAVASLAGRIGSEAGLAADSPIGIGTPGSISPFTGLIRNSNSVWLNGRPFHSDLEGRLGREVVMRNDADCFILSEARDGAAAGAGSAFGVIIGTGVGGGVFANGGLVEGPNGNSGEWGHNPLPWPTGDELEGPDCYCGLAGCIETYLSGAGLARDYRQRSGLDVDAPEVVGIARAGEEAASISLHRYVDRLARSLATVVNVLDPEVIVLGGGMSNIDELYDEVPLVWGEYVFSDSVATRLVRNLHGDSSGVRGAAWMVMGAS